MKKIIPEPHKIRKIPRSFSWIDHRLLRGGWVADMCIEELSVYTFLILASDKNGVSFYRKEKMGKIIDLDFPLLNKALSYLIDRELIAFVPFSAHSPNGYYQILEIPSSSPSGRWEELSGRTSGVESIRDILEKNFRR